MSSYSYPRPRACGHVCACDPCQIRKLECELQKLKQRVGECCDDRPTPAETVCDVFADAVVGIPETTDTALYKKTDNTFVKATTTQTLCGAFASADPDDRPEPTTTNLLLKTGDDILIRSTPCEIYNSLVDTSSVVAEMDPNRVRFGATVVDDNDCYSLSLCGAQEILTSNPLSMIGDPSNVRVPVYVDDEGGNKCLYITLQQIINLVSP